MIKEYGGPKISRSAYLKAGPKPVQTTAEGETADLIKKSHSKRGAPGTLKRKIRGKMTIAKAKALKSKPGATTMDKKQSNFFINMQRARNEDVAATSTASIPNPADTAMGPRQRMVRMYDKRRRKDKPPVMLKRFNKFIG